MKKILWKLAFYSGWILLGTTVVSTAFAAPHRHRGYHRNNYGWGYGYYSTAILIQVAESMSAQKPKESEAEASHDLASSAEPSEPDSDLAQELENNQ